MNFGTMGTLAELFDKISEDPELSVEDSRDLRRGVVGRALQSHNLQNFVDFYSQGWSGINGKFARFLARAMQAID